MKGAIRTDFILSAEIIAITLGTEKAQRGAGEILLTSMDRDGTKSGFNLELTRAVDVPVIASGGGAISIRWQTASCSAEPTRCWPPVSSTAANSVSSKPTNICAREVFRGVSESLCARPIDGSASVSRGFKQISVWSRRADTFLEGH